MGQTFAPLDPVAFAQWTWFSRLSSSDTRHAHVRSTGGGTLAEFEGELAARAEFERELAARERVVSSALIPSVPSRARGQ